jgi:AcrR family transcriptional regulator
VPRAARPKADTQARILEAAAALFMQHGYEGATIAAIAARAGVSRAAIFWHFSDKESLFEAAFRELLTPFFAELKKSLDALEPRARLFELFAAYEQFVSTHRATIEAIVRWVFESPSLRARLQRPLIGLLDQFGRDLHGSLADLVGESQEAAAVAAALASALHGNLLLALLDPSAERRALRSAGLRAIAEQLLAPQARQ